MFIKDFLGKKNVRSFLSIFVSVFLIFLIVFLPPGIEAPPSLPSTSQSAPPVLVVIHEKSILGLNVFFKSKVEGVRIFVDGLTWKPWGVPDPPGVVIKYFEVRLENVDVDVVDKAEFTFKVEKKLFLEKGVDVDVVKLCRYDADKSEWTVFQPVLLKKDISYVYYKVEVDRLSVFAVVFMA